MCPGLKKVEHCCTTAVLGNSGNTLPPHMGANVCHNMKGIHLTGTTELEKQAYVSGGWQGLGRVVSFHSIKGKKYLHQIKLKTFCECFPFIPQYGVWERFFFNGHIEI